MKILKGVMFLVGASALILGGKLVYDHYANDQVEDVNEDTANDENIDAVVDEEVAEDTAE